ncbi:MAG: ABC transporter permease, partial [Vulcanimicrobiota bacterium]
MLAIYRRELAAYFNSSLAWVLMAIYLFVLGLIFTGMVNSYSQYSMSAGMNPFMARSVNVMDDLVVPVQWWMGFLMLFILPLLTMRLIAEESRSGTLEMLFTYPLTEWQIVGGKFFAAQTVVATMLAFSSVSVVMLSRLTDIEWKLIGSGYLGLLLLGAAFTAFGLWASSTTSSQMIAAVVSYGGLMASWLIMILDDQITAVKETFGDLSM